MFYDNIKFWCQNIFSKYNKFQLAIFKLFGQFELYIVVEIREWVIVLAQRMLKRKTTKERVNEKRTVLVSADDKAEPSKS